MNTYFNYRVWGFGKKFPVALPETHPIRVLGQVFDFEDHLTLKSNEKTFFLVLC